MELLILLNHELIEFIMKFYGITKKNHFVMDDLAHFDPFIFNCTAFASGHRQFPCRLSVVIALELDDHVDEFIDLSISCNFFDWLHDISIDINDLVIVLLICIYLLFLLDFTLMSLLLHRCHFPLKQTLITTRQTK